MSAISLGDICEVTAGQSAPQDPSVFGEEGKPFIRAGSLEKLINGGAEEDCELIPVDNAVRLRLRLFPQNTILFAKSGMSAKIGRVHRLRTPSYVVSHLAAVIPGKKVDPSYLQRWFEKNPPSRLIPNEAYPSIRTSEISLLKISLPPLPEQKRIAAILDKADAIRRKRLQAIQLADKFLRSVFLDMFGDPASNPKGWQRKKIRQLGKVVTGNTPSRKISENYGDHIEWIKSDNINTPLHILTKAEEGLSETGANLGRAVPANSTLVTCIAGTPECIGNAALTDRKVAFNQQINAIVPFENVDSYFLYLLVIISKKIIQRASTNSMKGMVSKGIFQEIELISPPYILQKEFGSHFYVYLNYLEKQELQLKESDNLFNSLCQKAFRGEL